MPKNINTLDELSAELNKDPEFRKEYRRQKPYYDLYIKVVNRLNLTQEEKGLLAEVLNV